MTLLEQFRDLERRSEITLPVVTDRYGYAAFVAYVFRINVGDDKPSEWWVGEVDEGMDVTAVKRLG